MTKLLYNELPRPTFRWMKVNHLELDPLTEGPQFPFQPDIRQTGDAIAIQGYHGEDWPDTKLFAGANAAALEQAVHHGNCGIDITVPAGAKGSVWLEYTLSDLEGQIDGPLRVRAGDGSDLQLFLTFEGGAEKGGINIAEYFELGNDAHLKVSKVQLHDHNVRHVEHRYAVGGKNSTVDYVSAELGSSTSIIYYKTDLNHDENQFNSQAMYLGNGDQIFDFSYWVPTQGVKTNTDILTTGALMDTSKKYFRGTIDFLRGGKKAVGSESDVCLLLNKGVHSISIPLLLCKEDDVVGNHASSAGQIDKDKLFYLMSRGFNEAGAQLIIVESNIRPVIDALGDADMENKALQAVREKMQFCHKKGDCHDKCTKRFPHFD
jgi:Fe-S cluster assembly scaffold protein SufB